MPDWSEIKMEYVTGAMGYRKLAKNWGVSLCTLQEHGKKGEWPRLRKEYRAELQTKTIQKVAARNASLQVNRLEKIQQAADAMASVITKVFDDAQQFNRHLITVMDEGHMDSQCRVEKKIDTKAIKDLTGAMKDLTYVLRNVYDIPTMQEKAAMENAAERLKMEQQKANTGMAEDGECGVVEIAPVVQEVADE